MERIVFLDRSTVDAEFRVPGFEHEWIDHDRTTPDQIHERSAEATMLITNKVELSRVTIEGAGQLKMVVAAATGVDNIDLEACASRAIPVCNVRDYATAAVAEHVFALALALARNLPAYRDSIRDGAWSRSTQFSLGAHPIIDLFDATLAVIGVGTLGKRIAEIGAALGMRVLLAERKGAQSVRPGRTAFEDVLARADVLSLHAPADASSRHMIDRQALSRMKPNAILINTARGALVDPEALLEALRRKTIFGAGIDVLETEPPSSDHPLLEAPIPNLIVTPHVAWRTRRAQQVLADQVVENLEAFVTGRVKNRVV